MSTNFYLAFREAVQARDTITDDNVWNTITIDSTHIGKRSSTWMWHKIVDHDVDDAVQIGRVVSVRKWREIISNLPDNLVILDEYDREIEPEELLAEWDEVTPYTTINEYWDRFNATHSDRMYSGHYLDDEGYLMISGRFC